MVEYKGHRLQADTIQVWQSAQRDFPAMALSYQQANAALGRTAALYENSPTAFYPQWRVLRDRLQTVMGNSSTNLTDTGAALRKAVTDYCDQDSAASDALHSAQAKLGTSPAAIPKPVVPYGLQPGHTAGQQKPQYDPTDPVFGSAPPSGSYIKATPKVATLVAKAKQVDELRRQAYMAESAIGPVYNILPDGALWTETDHKAVETAVTGTAKNDAAQYQYAVDQIKAITRQTGTAIPFTSFNGAVNNAAQALDDDNWDSEAAQNFRTNFLNKYPDISSTQQGFTLTLSTALESYQNALDTAYTKISDTLDAAATSLQAIIDQGQTTAKFVISAAVLATLAIPVVGEGVLAASLFLATTAVSVATPAINFTEGTTAEITNTTVQGVNGLRGALTTFDHRLATGLRQDSHTIEVLRTSLPIEIPRPAFANQPALL